MLASVALDVHTAWAWVTVVLNLVAGGWATAAHLRPALRHRALWPFTTGAQASIFVAAGLGVWVVQGDGIEVPQLHLFYGVLAIVTVAIVYSYRSSSEWVRERLHLVYGLSGLFTTGLLLRAMVLQG